MPPNDAKLTVRLPRGHVDALRRGAQAEDRTVPLVVRRLVREYAEAVTSSARQEAGAEGTRDVSQEVRRAP